MRVVRTTRNLLVLFALRDDSFQRTRRINVVYILSALNVFALCQLSYSTASDKHETMYISMFY